ncbi:MAG TPA: hypothetical protein VFM18_12715 [Methanosarcina sp.]|nr:hypothetical protein [Methanosarcina sp.]
MTNVTFAQLIEIAEKNKDMPSTWFDIYYFFEKIFNQSFWSESVDVDDSIQSRYKTVPIKEWMCTDTMVGYHAHYFNGELFAITIKEARKSNKNLFWASKDAYQMIKNDLQQYADEEEIETFLPEDTVGISYELD